MHENHRANDRRPKITDDYRSALNYYNHKNQYSSKNNFKCTTYSLLLDGVKSYRHNAYC